MAGVVTQIAIVGGAVIAGFFMLWMGRASRHGTLRRNGWAGLRTRILVRSERSWLTGQRAAAKALIISSYGLFGTAVAIAISPPPLWPFACLAGLTWLGVWIAIGTIRAEHAVSQSPRSTLR
ncbi:hypothetical protein GCM10020360_04920 [Nonlabens tegetincola]